MSEIANLAILGIGVSVLVALFFGFALLVIRWNSKEVEPAKLQVKVKKCSPDAIIPHYATTGAACFDISCIDGGIIPVGGFYTFDTGLSFEVPEGYTMLVYSRSGHGFKHGVRLSNCVGIIDSDYRGVLKVQLHNDRKVGQKVEKGERIAQAKIVPIQQVQFLEVSTLSETDRGSGGFGSTGV